MSAQLLETGQKINAAKTKLLVADDQLNRLEIKAPRSGTVQGSKVFTVGQVMGEALMEIAPSGETLVVYAQLPVNSIEHLMVGADRGNALPRASITPDADDDEQARLDLP